MKLRFATSCIVFAACALLGACAGTPPNPNPRAEAQLQLAPSVDLKRFMGRWYVIANIPYFAEKGYVGSYVEYALRPDGDIDDFYFGRDGGFDQPLEKKTLKDWVVKDSHNAEWRSSPFWPLSFSYLILYVDKDYRYALVGYPGKKWGWIFAREAHVDPATYMRLLAELERQGYDTTRFRRIPQDKGQLGLPGFQTP